MKHAICILAHKNWDRLFDLIDTLGSSLVDVYLHIDLKARNDFNRYVITNNLKCAPNVYIIESKSVSWGYSQLTVELSLFREVLKLKERYNYVHLISGQDFPLMPTKSIVDICNAMNVDFLSYNTGCDKNRYLRRLKYYNILVPYVRTSFLCAYIRKFFMFLQICLGVNRLRSCPLTFEVGANWMSITIESLKYIVDEFPKYERYFKHGISAEESYKQMILKTRQGSRIVNNCKRFVVFDHLQPSPKTLTIDMLDKIEASDAFFARKFDDSIDRNARLAIKKKILRTR